MRDARAPDLAAIVELLADDELGRSREAPGDPGYERAFAAIDGDGRHRLIVAVLDDEIVGTFQLSFLPNMSHRGSERAMIEGVRVAAPHRRAGIGRQMMEWAVDESRRRGCAMVQLTSNATRADAHVFYESLGFQQTHVGMKLVL